MAGQPYEAEAWTGLEDAFEQRLRALVEASGGRVWMVSGYRSVEHQERLWQQALVKYGSEAAARKWVAPPGKSNHNHGSAADLGGTEEGMAWMRQNAHRFGLHLPMSWEPWHVEPVHTALDGDPDAYTTPPLGVAPANDPTDPGVQFVRMLALLDQDTQLVEGPDAGIVDAPGGELTVDNPSGITLDSGAVTEDFGFAEIPGMNAEAVEQTLEDVTDG